jgi:hypothetical protein
MYSKVAHDIIRESVLWQMTMITNPKQAELERTR